MRGVPRQAEGVEGLGGFKRLRDKSFVLFVRPQLVVVKKNEMNN